MINDCSHLLLLMRCWIFLGLFLSTSGAFAWNATGHRLTAAIAWQHMNLETRIEVGQLLRNHPDHSGWLQRNPHDEHDYAAFLEASTWPDDIRHDPRFHDDDEPSTQVIEGFPDTARHRDWHYVNRPLNTTSDADSIGGELDLQLPRLNKLLADRNEDRVARAYALAWLTHLIGDAHQPLHTVSRLDSDGRSDKGGNALLIENPFHPHRRITNLHAYWDDLPGPPWLRGKRLEQLAEKLIPLNTTTSTPGTVGQWLAEGRSLAATVVYEGLAGDVPTVNAAYHERAQRIVWERLAIAGKRLALILMKALGH